MVKHGIRFSTILVNVEKFMDDKIGPPSPKVSMVLLFGFVFFSSNCLVNTFHIYNDCYYYFYFVFCALFIRSSDCWCFDSKRKIQTDYRKKNQKRTSKNHCVLIPIANRFRDLGQLSVLLKEDHRHMILIIAQCYKIGSLPPISKLFLTGSLLSMMVVIIILANLHANLISFIINVGTFFRFDLKITFLLSFLERCSFCFSTNFFFSIINK